MEDDPNYLAELEHDLLTHRDHSLPSSKNISTHLGFLWPIKQIYMDHVRGRPREHPYAVQLKFGIGDKEKVFMSKRLHS